MKNINQLSESNKIAFARSQYLLFPISTRVHLALKTKLPVAFLKKHWKQITGHTHE